MTFEEAEQILGPQLAAEIDERARLAREANPLSPEKIARLVGILTADPVGAPASDAA